MGATCSSTCASDDIRQSVHEELRMFGDTNVLHAKFSDDKSLALIIKMQALVRMVLAKINFRRMKVDPDAFMLVSPADSPNLWFKFERVQR